MRTLLRREMGLEHSGYYAARFLSQAGQNIFVGAILVATGLNSDHLGLSLGGVFLAFLLPQVLFSVLAGAVADRLGVGRALVLGGGSRLAVAALSLAMLNGPISAWALAFAYSTGSQLLGPAEMAMVRFVQRDATRCTHSILIAVQYGGGAASIGVGAGLYFLGGAPAMLAGAVVAFGLLTGLAMVLAYRLRHHVAASHEQEGATFSFRRACGFFRSERCAQYALTTLGVRSITMRAIAVVLPLYVNHEVGLGADGGAALLLPGVIGVAAGLAWASRSVTLDRARPTMRLALVGMAVAVLALAMLDRTLVAAFEISRLSPVSSVAPYLNTTVLVGVPVAFLLGASLSGALVSARVALTETAPAGHQARVFAVQNMLTEVAMLAPLALVGAGADFVGARPLLAGIGVLALTGIVALELPGLLRRTPELAPVQI